MGVIAFLVVFVGGWIWLAKYWRRHGHGKAVSVVGAGVATFIAGSILGAYIDGAFKDAPPGAAPVKVAEAAKPSEPAPSTLATAKSPVPEAPKQPEPSLAPKDFGLTLSQYVANVNELLKQDNIRGTVKAERKKDEKEGAYTVAPSKHVFALVWTDKPNGNVTGLTVMSRLPSGKKTDGDMNDHVALQDLLGAAASEDVQAEVFTQVNFMRDEATLFGIEAKRAVPPYVLSYSVMPMMVMAGIKFGELPKPVDSGDKSRMAYVQCQEQVRGQLKAPSTAHFPWAPDRSVRNESQPNSYVVVGHVDAQNSYGAMLRAQWGCSATYKGHGDDANPGSWTFANVGLLEEGA